MKYNRNYHKKMAENRLPRLTEENRIYLNVPYMARSFAQISNCRFDPDKKLWFTGLANGNLKELIELYGVNETTSEKVLQLLKEKHGNS